MGYEWPNALQTASNCLLFAKIVGRPKLIDSSTCHFVMDDTCNFVHEMVRSYSGDLGPVSREWLK